ncbi:MAG: TIGR02710 family CRISPR-associated CARF protein [Candidatus Bathyarchaeia archaeon]
MSERHTIEIFCEVVKRSDHPIYNREDALKALVISVGTGTLGSDENTKGLAEALAYSVRHHSPDKVFFVVTKESAEKTLPKVLQVLKEFDYEIIELKSPDNLQHIYDELRGKIAAIRRSYSYFVVDFTSGTKSMTAALAILGAIYGANELSYISGKRQGGVVQSGTEHILSIRPYFIIAEQRFIMAVEFFNASQYEACASILRNILSMTRDPDILQRFEPILRLAEAYAMWDRFQHQKAFDAIREIGMKEIEKNKRFLGKLLNAYSKGKDVEPYIIADLINNARRRGECELKYDDAVARLYRTTELIAQYKLKRDHQIDASKADPCQMPPELISERGMKIDGPIKLGLDKSYRLLFSKGDELGKYYVENEELRGLLSKRNLSILAHGIEPVDRNTYVKLLEFVTQLAHKTVEDLHTLLEDSAFIKILQ